MGTYVNKATGELVEHVSDNADHTATYIGPDGEPVTVPGHVFHGQHRGATPEELEGAKPPAEEPPKARTATEAEDGEDGEGATED